MGCLVSRVGGDELGLSGVPGWSRRHGSARDFKHVCSRFQLVLCMRALSRSPPPSLSLCVLACARQAMSEGTMGKRGAEVKAEPDEEPSAKKTSKAWARSLSDEKQLPGSNRASGPGSKAKAATTTDGGRDASTPHKFFGFEFTTKQMAKAVSKLHLSISKDSSNDTIKRLVSSSPRLCIPVSGVAYMCFHRVCDSCLAARLPLVGASSCQDGTRLFWASALTAIFSWARRMSWE